MLRLDRLRQQRIVMRAKFKTTIKFVLKHPNKFKTCSCSTCETLNHKKNKKCWNCGFPLFRKVIDEDLKFLKLCNKKTLFYA